MTEGAYLYILRCVDGSYYIGTTRTELELRIAQHNAGTFGGYTKSRRPVTLVFSQWFDRITDAIECERKLKKWSRAKKEAFMRGDFAELHVIGKARISSSFETPTRGGLLRMRAECAARGFPRRTCTNLRSAS
ncbi:putative endonuclease [Bradyrhizobium sp. i1.3.1]